MTTDYYSVLGVAQNATEKQIRARFLELARERHPDRYRGPDKDKIEAEFQEITQAFNVLTDANRRRELDRRLSRPGEDEGGSSKEAARVYVSRGLQSLRAGEVAQAIQNLERATEEDPTYGKAWYQLGRAYSKRPGGRAKARATLAKACDVEPMNAVFLREAGKAFDAGEMYAEAAKFYKKALDWGGEDAETRAAFEAAVRSARSN